MKVAGKLWVFVLILSVSSVVKSERLSLEADMAVPIAAKGMHLHIKRSNTFFDNFTLGASFATMTLRDWVIDTMPEAKGKGWQVDIIGAELTYDYFFSDPDDGLFLGPVLALSQLNLSRQGSASTVYEYQTGLRFGYLWRPWNNGFYLLPWGAVGIKGSFSGSYSVEGETFPSGLPSPIVGAANIGYTF